MTNTQKAQAIARMFEQGRETDAYAAMRFMLDTRGILTPADLEAAKAVDILCAVPVPKDRPINQEAA